MKELEDGLISMTGYGRGEVAQNGLRVVTEMRSVNHRFLEIVVRLPQGYLSFEESVRKIVAQSIKRGRVDVFISIEREESQEDPIQIDWKRLEKIVALGKEAEQKFNIPFSIRWTDIIQNPDFWFIEENVDLNAHREPILQSVRQATHALFHMRKREGAVLAQDLEHHLKKLREIVEWIEGATSEVQQHIETRLKNRLTEMLKQTDIEMDRIVMEVAIWVEKADITEELTRLKSHTTQFQQMLKQQEPVGRKLDFLLQEMNREINTIGSKANHQAISSWVVAAKSELEKMKEQVQNIE